MWSLLRRLLDGPPAPPDPYAETIQFDDAGFTRALGPADGAGRRQFWPWDDVCEFGFRFTPALFPDPWIGDCMEGLWYLRVRDEGALMAVEFGQEHLDPDALPDALLRHMPGLDRRALRDGLAVAARGPRHFAGEGEWVGWRRDPHCA
ncbi:hypothetical protein [Achromobacter ruhlandii]|uniref:hypothetical protein n=1 Tax=Achromobacter ruhlandii TaxID=72557 RepID=UPI000C255D84|nr:hypothetical protein [Achromobacter ruhlandii]PJM70181.1 hypothetical protein CV751_10895 [Achromobacter ruhlandii]